MQFNKFIKLNLLLVTVIMLACPVFGIEASMPPSGPGSAYANNLTENNATNVTIAGSGSSLFHVGRLNWIFPSLRYIISMRFFVVLKPLAQLFAD